MHMIVCIDEKRGMMFGGRRQSRDSEVCREILRLASGSRLLMSVYSAKLFGDGVVGDDGFTERACPGDFCFIEDTEMPECGVEDIYIFCWNRKYPADKYFTFDLKENGYKKVKETDFAGSSHQNITLKIYKKE